MAETSTESSASTPLAAMQVTMMMMATMTNLLLYRIWAILISGTLVYFGVRRLSMQTLLVKPVVIWRKCWLQWKRRVPRIPMMYEAFLPN